MTLVWRPGYTWNESIWNPSMITTALWLDAADSSTVTTVSGAVSQWNDKSGNGRNATQDTAGSRPAYASTVLNGKNVINFDGSDNWLGLAASIFSNQTAFSWYAVVNRDTTDNQTFFMERFNNNNAMVSLQAGETISILNRAGGTSSSGLIEQTESVSFPVSNPQILGSVQAATSGTAYRNGTATATNSSTKASLAFRRLVLGGAVASSGLDPTFGWVNGYIAEFVVALSTHSTDTRQRIEGYLAHKWGLTGNLPNDHPYKILGPTP